MGKIPGNKWHFPFNQKYRFEIPSIPCGEWNLQYFPVGAHIPSFGRMESALDYADTFYSSLKLKLSPSRMISLMEQYYPVVSILKGFPKILEF